MTSNPQPVIILVEPQLGENIGMCARAMLNCGLDRLRLVRPRGGWPQDRASATAADADRVLEQTEVFDDLCGAIADCSRVLATTARERSLEVPVLTVSRAAGEMRRAAEAGDRIAVLFGPEASGLDNEAISRADSLLRFPVNPEFASLNLAQAVLLFCWEWRRAEGGDESDLATGGAPESFLLETGGVERAALDQFLGRLESALEERGFFLTEKLKPHSLRVLRAIFAKTNPSPEELKFLHGMLTALVRPGPGSGGDRRGS